VKRAGWPELRLLAVAPMARGAGVGQALVDECVRRARASGHSELGLHTSESLRAAVRMYERMGFERAPEHDLRPEGAELVMAYRLPLNAR
jgi:ribosomal protein S18 acetylase RimI-like enzyme